MVRDASLDELKRLMDVADKANNAQSYDLLHKTLGDIIGEASRLPGLVRVRDWLKPGEEPENGNGRG